MSGREFPPQPFQHAIVAINLTSISMDQQILIYHSSTLP
jgi:hypothetical protein